MTSWPLRHRGRLRAHRCHARKPERTSAHVLRPSLATSSVCPLSLPLRRPGPPTNTHTGRAWRRSSASSRSRSPRSRGTGVEQARCAGALSSGGRRLWNCFAQPSVAKACLVQAPSCPTRRHLLQNVLVHEPALAQMQRWTSCSRASNCSYPVAQHGAKSLWNWCLEIGCRCYRADLQSQSTPARGIP